MKIRNDYVSNSSSSSFIVKESAPKAIKMFYEDFKDSMNYPDPLGETMHIYIRYKGDDSYWTSTYFEDFVKDIEEGKKTFDDIDSFTFDCDDWDTTGCMYLNFLYLYFQKFGFKPDDSDTEHPFRGQDETSNHFLTRILNRLNFSPTEGKDTKTT